MSKAVLDIYPSPIPNGDYLASFSYDGVLPEPVKASTSQTRTILIVDQSGSMGQYCQRVLTLVFPKLLAMWNCPADQKIDLILFESKTNHYVHKVSEFPTLPYRSSGGTYFAPVFDTLKSILKSIPNGSNVRILTVSDGDISDPHQTLPQAANMNEAIQNTTGGHFPQLNIESNAIRLFTSSYANPDTRALSSVLQFSTSLVVPTLIDIPFEVAQLGPEKIWASISSELPESCFAKSYLALDSVDVDNCTPADSKNVIFKKQPWAEAAVSMRLIPSTTKTLFWLSHDKFDPTQQTKFTISGVETVVAQYHTTLAPPDWAEMIKTRINYYMMQVKLLRVVGQESSLNRLNLIANYFIKLESYLFDEVKAVDMTDGADTPQVPLKQRLEQLHKNVKAANSRIGLQLQEVLNMDKATSFNAAQAASFLRSTTGTGSSSRGLVRRAGTDLDFDSIIQREVVELAAHLHELEDKITPEIESNMNESFVSLATTLDGIRGLCSLATTDELGDEFDVSRVHEMSEKSLLSTLTGFQILTYLNIVGVPVQSTIGDYPDPYRYNINVVHSGHYCSLSDLMLHHEIVEGGNPNQNQSGVKIAGQTAEAGRVDNVIPVFESPEIFRFLYKYAPETLNLYCSIGMRRMLASIPGTLPATLSAALVKLMRVVIVEPTEVNIKALTSVYSSLKVCSTVNYNTPAYGELFAAAAYHSDFRLGNFKDVVTELNRIDGSGGDNDDDEIVQLSGEDNIAPTSYTAPKGTPKLVQISSGLTQLILPLINLYTIAETRTEYPKSFEAVFKKLTGKTDPIVTIHALKEALPAILRSIYINEAYTTLRSVYRGKPDSTQIIQKNLHSLIGFSSEWEPELKPPFETDDEFNYETQVPEKLKQSKLTAASNFKSFQNKIARLNFLIALPSFAKLFNAINNNETATIDELIASIPKVLSTPETPAMLQKANQIAKLRQQLYHLRQNPNRDYDDYWSEDEYDYHDNTDNSSVPELEAKLAEINEERQGLYDEVQNSVEFNFPTAFFGLNNDNGDVDTAVDYLNNFQCYAMLTSFMYYTQPNERFPTGVYDSLTMVNDAYKPLFTSIPDVTYDELKTINSNPFLSSSLGYQKQLYKRAYQSAVKDKIKSELGQVFVEYTKQLLTATTLDQFKTLLKDGLVKSRCSAEFKKGFQDPNLDLFWKQLVDDNVDVPLRCEKLQIIISGRDEKNEPIWNNGRVLFHHTLHKASKFFYNDDQRQLWIDICQDYKTRRAQWEYRLDKDGKDLPNRHTHCNARPSYWAKGFETLDDFKAGVDKDVWEAYCQEHKTCCGFGSGEKKIKKAKK